MGLGAGGGAAGLTMLAHESLAAGSTMRDCLDDGAEEMTDF